MSDQMQNDLQSDGGQEPAKAQASKTETSAELPDFVKDPDKAFAEIKNLREENAKWRTELRELQAWREERQKAEEQAQEQELVQKQQFEELANQYKQRAEQLQAQLAQFQRDAAKNQIVAELGMPSELAARVQGETPEEMRADAEKLMSAIRSLMPQQTDTGSASGTPPAQQAPNFSIFAPTQNRVQQAAQRQMASRQSTTPVPTGQSETNTREVLRSRIYGGGGKRGWSSGR